MITIVENEKHRWEFKTIPVGKSSFRVLRNGEGKGLVKVLSKNRVKVQSEALYHKGLRRNYEKLNYKVIV